MKSLANFRNSHCSRRRGSVLVCVLVCLAIAVALVTSMVRNALDERRAARSQLQVRQTELLLAAGIQRAREQLRASADYAGETWEVPAEAVGGVEPARVTIDLSPDEAGGSPAVRVTARLATGPHTSIQRSYRCTFESQ